MTFDKIAPIYGTLVGICAGNRLSQCRSLLIDQIHNPTNILIAGEGHGPFLGICESRYPNAKITVIESSDQMIQIAKSKHPSTRATFIHEDLLEWELDTTPFDLIVTHFFLDCFNPSDLKKAINKLSRVATEDTQWLISDFNIPDSGPQMIRAKVILWMLYQFFRFSIGLKADSLTTPDPLLREHGFTRIHHKTLDWGLLKSELWRRHTDHSLRDPQPATMNSPDGI